MRKLILLAGHHRAGWYIWPHWRDTGAVPIYDKNMVDPPVYNEHHENEKLAWGAMEQLKSEGYKVFMPPFDYNLWGKIRWINNNFNTDDIVLSIHMNGNSDIETTGSEVWYYQGSDVSRIHALRMAKIISDTLQIKNRGRKGDLTNRHGRLAIIRYTRPWAWLLELGYLTNINDLRQTRKFGIQAIVDTAKYLHDNL